MVLRGDELGEQPVDRHPPAYRKSENPRHMLHVYLDEINIPRPVGWMDGGMSADGAEMKGWAGGGGMVGRGLRTAEVSRSSDVVEFET